MMTLLLRPWDILATTLLLLSICMMLLVPGVRGWAPTPAATGLVAARLCTTRTSSVLFSSTTSLGDLDDDNDDDEHKNHLITAGRYFKGIDEDVGNAMINAGKAWTSDWSLVAEALDQAASAFWDTLSKKNLPAGLQTICRSVAQELEDISTIEGCSSVGPASSLPNWIAICGYLESATVAYENDPNHEHIYQILQRTSREIEALVESI